MKKNLIVLQDGIKECGSAALLSIIRYYGGDISINRLVELTKTNKSGTNFYNLSLACHELGLNACGYKIEDKKKIKEVNEPFICQFINKNYSHFVVVYKIKNDKIIIMDPAKGKVVMKQEMFFNLWTGYILIIKPYKKLPVIKTKKYLNKVITEVLVKNKTIIVNIFVLSLIFTLLTCIYSFYFQVIIDYIINTTINNLFVISFIFLIIIILKSLIDFSRNELLIYLNQKLDLSIFTYSFNKIILLPYNYYKNKTTGEVISRINDLAYVKNLLSKIIITVFLDLLICLVGSIILFNINSKMFFITLIIVIIYLVILYIFRPIMKNLTNLNQEKNALVNSYMIETISGFETVKGLNIETNIISKMKKKYINTLEMIVNFDKINILELLLKDLTSNIGILLILTIGTYEVMNNHLSIGSLITFNSLLIYFLEPIRNIIDLNKDYYYAINSLKRINNLLEIESEKLELSNIDIKGNIKIKNLSFSYNGIDKVLDNVSFNINEGEKILILGNSGSGKSTVLKILYRYYNCKRDEIFINDNDLLDYKTSDIKKNFCYISQNEMLFTDSIKNNVVLSRDIKEEEFLEVAKITYINKIIKDYLLGYDTMLEENGVNISGGQRQRIILARALLKKSNFMLIDEGLNEIDINLERKILKNIFTKYYDKTFLIVSHRLDNIDLYDKVIKIQDGKVIDVITRNRGDINE